MSMTKSWSGFADLRRGEADAGRRVHRLGHVVDRARWISAVTVVDLLAGIAEALVGVVEDGADGHGATLTPA